MCGDRRRWLGLNPLPWSKKGSYQTESPTATSPLACQLHWLPHQFYPSLLLLSEWWINCHQTVFISDRGAFVADSLNWFVQKRTHCRAPAQREVSRRVTQNSQGISATFHEVTACASQSEHPTDYFCDPRLLILQWHAESAPFSSPLFSKRLAILSKFHCWQWAQLALCPGLRISFRSSSLFTPETPFSEVISHFFPQTILPVFVLYFFGAETHFLCCFQSLAGQSGCTVYPLLRLLVQSVEPTSKAWSVSASKLSTRHFLTFWFGM